MKPYNEQAIQFFLILVNLAFMGTALWLISAGAGLSVIWTNIRKEIIVCKKEYGGNWKLYLKESNPFS